MAPRKREHAPLGNHFLREWREHKRLRQEDVAEQIGYDGGTISKIEDGKTPYTQRTLEALARVYGTSPSALLSIDPLEETVNQLDRMLNGILIEDAPSIHKLIGRIKGLSPANVEAFVTMIVNTITANAASREQTQTGALSEPSIDRRESSSSL